jgi:hypothetical protein
MSTTKISYTWTPTGGVALNGDREITHVGGQSFDFAITGGATDQAIDFNAIATSLVGLWLKCDRALTIQVNDGTTPAATITLAAGSPFCWLAAPSTTAVTDPLSPCTVDISALYCTLAAGANATLNVRTLQNSITPPA